MNDIEPLESMEPLDPLFEMLELLISRYGSVGIAAAMFAESSGVPFASVLVLLAAGPLILRGSVSFWSIFLASTIGITLGSIFSYIIGLLGSMAGTAVKSGFFNHSRNIENEISSPKKSKLIRLWKKYGNFSIFMAQLWGVTRTFGSFPAGAMHINFYLFIIYTFLGGALFSLIYIAASVALAGTMNLTIKLLRYLADLSPWLLSIPVVLIIAVVYYYFFYRPRNPSAFNFHKTWNKLRCRFTNK